MESNDSTVALPPSLCTGAGEIPTYWSSTPTCDIPSMEDAGALLRGSGPSHTCARATLDSGAVARRSVHSAAGVTSCALFGVPPVWPLLSFGWGQKTTKGHLEATKRGGGTVSVPTRHCPLAFSPLAGLDGSSAFPTGLGKDFPINLGRDFPNKITCRASVEPYKFSQHNFPQGSPPPSAHPPCESLGDGGLGGPS